MGSTPSRAASAAGIKNSTIPLKAEIHRLNTALAALTVSCGQLESEKTVAVGLEKAANEKLRYNALEIEKLRSLAEQHRKSVSIASSGVNTSGSESEYNSGSEFDPPRNKSAHSFVADVTQHHISPDAIDRRRKIAGNNGNQLTTVPEEDRIPSSHSLRPRSRQERRRHREGVSAPAEQEAHFADDEAERDGIEHTLPRPTAKDVESIIRALKANPFTAKFDEVQRSRITAEMRMCHVRAGDEVISAGKEGDRLYVTHSGLFRVTKADGTLVRQLGSYQVIGEMAILYRCRRTATVVAIEDGALWFIDQPKFHHTLYLQKCEVLARQLNFLKKVDFLQGVQEDYLQRILEACTERVCTVNEVLVDVSIPESYFFILVEGEVLVLQSCQQADATSNDKQVSGENDPRPVRSLYPGAHFGHNVLLGDYNASCKVIKTEATVLMLDAVAFHELVVPLEALGKIKFDNIFGQTPAIPLNQNGFEDVTLNQCRPVALLGSGGFGRVELVALESKKDRFALKGLSIASINQHGQQDHVLNEKRALEKINSPFCIRLFATFRSDSQVFFLTEACLGGELWSHLRRLGKLSETASRYYTASIIEGIGYLHGMGLVYRDLKPENITLDSGGHAKIIDFGFAKELKRQDKTWTFCGTPDYMAPEIVMNQGHDFSVDFWSIGVLVFELLAGEPPFASSDPMETYNHIVQGIAHVSFPANFSKSSKNLISALCKPCPRERLGTLHDGIAGLRHHSWFSGFDWAALQRRQLLPPISPATTPQEMETVITDSTSLIPPSPLKSSWAAEFGPIEKRV